MLYASGKFGDYVELKFGKVVKYFENGFGFVQPLSNQNGVSNKEIFFHIKKVKKYESELDNFRSNNLNPLYFWFTTDEGKKGQELSQAWNKSEDIPTDLTNTFLNALSSTYIKSDVITPEPKLSSVPKVYNAIPAKPLLSNVVERNIPQLCEKYRLDPLGIRNDKNMRHVCLDCGTDNSEYRKSEKEAYKLVSQFVASRYSKSAEGFHRCCNCGSKWYINYCWSCHTGRVDDRDPKTPHCKECSWCKCDKCSSCSYYGCKTNEYSKDHKYADNQHIEF